MAHAAEEERRKLPLLKLKSNAFCTRPKSWNAGRQYGQSRLNATRGSPLTRSSPGREIDTSLGQKRQSHDKVNEDFNSQVSALEAELCARKCQFAATESSEVEGRTVPRSDQTA